MRNSPIDIDQITSVKNEIRKCFADLGSFTTEEINTAVELLTIKTLKRENIY